MSSPVKTEQLSSITSLLSPGRSAFKRGFTVIRHDFKKMRVQNCHNHLINYDCDSDAYKINIVFLHKILFCSLFYIDSYNNLNIHHKQLKK